MTYDLVVRNGVVVDGSGAARYRGDVGVIHGRIARVGRIRERARTEIDAEGMVVSPGFIDGHTHMDAQISWDPLGTCSCWHGVTSVVMGNCGFTLAPARKNERHLVVRNLERAEDISAAAMAEGIEWNWETFPEYLDAIARLPKGINYGGYVGHSALRTWAMGERAFEEEGTAEDLAVMARELRDALRAGALGFTTSRSFNHQTSDDRPVASRLANWAEVTALVGVMASAGAGIFELANEDLRSADADVQERYYRSVVELAVSSGVPTTFGVNSTRDGKDGYHRRVLGALDQASSQGGLIYGQAHAREFNVVLSFKTQMPFDALPEWKQLRSLPLDEQMQALRDPTVRAHLLGAARSNSWPTRVGAEARKPDYEWIRIMDGPTPPYRTVAEVAAARGVDPAECMVDLALESDFEQFFLQPILNGDQDVVLDIMKHPRCIPTFSDSGAHVSQLMDASIPTYLLAHWTREKQAFSLEQAIQKITLLPAIAWGFHDRGLIREGLAADLCVFDPEVIGPEMPYVASDLPGGSTRLIQKSTGILATIVNGEVLLNNGEHSGAYPGVVLRGPLARR